MKASNIYGKLFEYSYFFNSRFNALKDTCSQVARINKNFKSVKVINTDPVTFEFITKGELDDETINRVSEYIVSSQPSRYNYQIERTKRGYTMELDVSYIEADDSLPVYKETVLSKTISRKIKARMRSLEIKRAEECYGARNCEVDSQFEKVIVKYSQIDKRQYNIYADEIEDIIENNDGEVKETVLDGNSIVVRYKDNSVVLKSETESLVDSDESEMLSKCEQEYYDYLVKHIGWVVDAFDDLCKHKDEIPYLSDEERCVRLRKQIEKHDDSKYTTEEFEAYRKHFYPANDADKLNSEEYESAWIHHYTTNPHHWEYWCILNPETGEFELQDDIDEEEYKFFEIERICDWISMSKIYNNRVKDWRLENADKIVEPDFIKDFEDSILDVVHKYELDVNKED